MYTDALEYLEEERDAWAPIETLLDLPDEILERPTAQDGPAHGWRGRDLVAHLVGWQEISLAAAKELAVNETSPTVAHFRAVMDSDVDRQNELIFEEWGALPLDEVRRRGREVAGELRGHLTVVPETRWLKNPEHIRFFSDNGAEHYEEHRVELEAIIAGASGTPDA
jgi:hypothetical protein